MVFPSRFTFSYIPKRLFGFFLYGQNLSCHEYLGLRAPSRSLTAPIFLAIARYSSKNLLVRTKKSSVWARNPKTQTASKGIAVFFLLFLAYMQSPLLGQNFEPGEHTLGISRIGITGTLGDPLTGGAFFRPVLVLRYGYQFGENAIVGMDVGGDLAAVSNGTTGGTLVWTGIALPYLRYQIGKDELSFFLEGSGGVNYRFWNLANLSPWVLQARAIVGLTYRPNNFWSLDVGLGYQLSYDASVDFVRNGSTPRLGFNFYLP